uniref:Uncharacterized protein n=1 Tax=Chrysotila carterae TaxID=13221 RepID=A0A7S4BN75_CHRCT|mmetsp:Transcript_1609/g.3348  ORF Transcript_1609/g.3348 Transcript_1609/m.3348 type:complete len:415 (+) Transcript_1609:405-1649(+)
MPTLWPLGVAIYITGTIGESLGANLQRLSLRTDQAKPKAEHVPKSKQKMWVAGFVLFVCSGLFMSLALFFASQTQLAPMQLFLFASNIVFAHVLNQEIFYLRTDGVATLFVVAGVVMAVVAAPHQNHDQNNEEMLALMRAPSFIVFLCLTVSFIVVLWTLQRRFMRESGNQPRTLKKKWKRYTVFLSFGALAGALGGLNITLTKSTFSLIVGQYGDGGVLGVVSSPVLWLTAITLVSTYVLQMVFTVVGIEHCSAVIIISTHAVTEEVTSALGGLLFFQDYQYFEAWEWAVFVTGQVISVVAVWCLAHFRLRYEREGTSRREASLTVKATSTAVLPAGELPAPAVIAVVDEKSEEIASISSTRRTRKPSGPMSRVVDAANDISGNSSPARYHRAFSTDMEAARANKPADGGMQV